MIKEIRLTIWIITFLLLVAAFLFWFLYPLKKKKSVRKNYVKAYYKKVSKVAKYGDLFLINNLKIHSNDPHSPKIDHLLVGNKYFYLIYDYYFEGALEANINDDFWIHYQNDKLQERIYNPLKYASDISLRFSLADSIPYPFIKTIVIINDDCFISELKNDYPSIILTPLSKVVKLIERFENEHIGKFDEKEIESVIKRLSKQKEVQK